MKLTSKQSGSVKKVFLKESFDIFHLYPARNKKKYWCFWWEEISKFQPAAFAAAFQSCSKRLLGCHFPLQDEMLWMFTFRWINLLPLNCNE